MNISKNKKIIQIIEYERIFKEDIGEKKFEELEGFILENYKNSEDNELFLKIRESKGRKYITAQKYVGIIQFKDGTTIEILPKILKSKENKYGEEDYKKSREILIIMIKTLRNHPFKTANMANLKNSKMPLFEIFIKMFLDELDKVIKFGIRSNYLLKNDNLKFLKGKLLINKQIKRNYIHKERFYVEYEEFSIDRVENRLIKTTLIFLQKRSKSNQNQKMIKRYLMFFDSVSTSHNMNDFKKVNITRDLLYYKLLISYCEIFLNNQSFSIYKGKNISFALLFNMNTLFESYIGDILKKNCSKVVKLQDKKLHLAYSKENKKQFLLKPDITIDNGKIILDTKWKIIDDSKKISSADMYQLYAYGMNYEKCEKLYLIYPNSFEDKYRGVRSFKFNKFNDNKDIELNIIFFDFNKSKEVFMKEINYFSF